MVYTEDIIKKYDLFWQYPVITEKEFYNQNKKNDLYIGIPWATLIDIPSYNNNIINIITSLKLLLTHTKEYYTCCQHIYFKKLIKIWEILGIKTVYISHKVIGEDYLQNITLYPCPLYAVNIEDDTKNSEFKNKDFLNYKRNILYSFCGGYQSHYISKIRYQIFNMKHPDSTYIKYTGGWHFNNQVYTSKQNSSGDLNIDDDYIKKTKSYNTLLLISKYSLVPSGAGPNSIRFWEALAAGSIPILLADTLDLPYHELWEKAIIRIKEKDLYKISDILSKIDNKIEHDMRKNCLKIYKHFKNNYNNNYINNHINV